MHALPRKALITAAILSTLTVISACGGQDVQQTAASGSVEVPQSPQDPTADAVAGSASPSASGSSSASARARAGSAPTA